MKKLTATLFAALVAGGTWADTWTDPDTGYTWTYQINGDTAEIYNNGCAAISPKPTGAVIIPFTLGGKPVTSIEEYAFYGCDGLTSVTIPDSVTTIGAEAFYGCSDALFDATTIAGVKLVDGWAVGNTGTLSGNLDLTGVRGIAAYAFYGCRGLGSVTIGNSVTSIGDNAFKKCSGLTSVTIPDSVKSIGGQVFYGCSSLTNVTIGSGVTSIGQWAFDGCGNALFDTTTIAGVKLVDGWAVDNTGTLSGNLDLTGVRGIGGDAFSGCSSLTSVTIPNSVTSIGEYAFACCGGLTGVTIPASVTSIGNGAFSHCSGLTSVTIPDSVTSIGEEAFRDCSGLTIITIPNSVTTIRYRAFDGCSGFTSVTIPDSVTEIGGAAFDNCTNLTSVTIPQCVCSSGMRVFATDSITNVVISDSVTSIGEDVFSGCGGLTSVTIPSSVTSIGGGAFSGCSGLMSVRFLGNAPTIGLYCYYDVDASCVVYVNKHSTGWGVDIPGTWNGLRIEYIEDDEPPSPTTFTLTYAPGANGTGEQQTVTKTNDVVLALEGAIFTRDGYTQTGWSMSDGGAKVYDLGASYTANATVTLYPFWTENGGGDDGVESPVYYALVLKPSSTKYGTVSGGGKYTAGSNRTIKAKAKSGYVFAGWFKDKSCKKPLNPDGYDNRSPTVKIVMPASDTTIYAKFVTKAADKKALKFSSATKKLAKTPAKATAGKAFSLKLGISSASLPTFAAKGLPKGLSVDKATGEIKGKATKPGSYTATITVTDAAGNKITQNVKFKVSAPSWATGTFYGTARPDGKTAAYLQFSVGSTGKVSGKVNFKGKAYSFASAYTSCTAAKATFAPSVKVGSSTFKPGTVAVKTQKMDGLSVVGASNAKGSFAAQKKPNLVKKGKPLAALVGKTFTFTKKDANSGLTKSKDKLSVKLGNGDVAKVSGTVKGKSLKALSWVTLVSDKETVEGSTAYTLYVDIIDAALKYEKTLVITATVGPGGTTADAAFAK